MTVTRCLTLPDLRDPEEMAMFTFSRLLNPSQFQTATAGELLPGINQYIFNTWGVNITGGIFRSAQPSNHQSSTTRKSPELDPGTRGWDLWFPIILHHPNTAIHHAYVLSQSFTTQLPSVTALLAAKQTLCDAAPLKSYFLHVFVTWFLGFFCFLGFTWFLFVT